MKILFLDDCVERTKRFKSFYPDCISTTGSKSMINILKLIGDEIDYVFLDHDLDITQEYNPYIEEGTGIEVARYIVEHRVPIKSIIVHSCNIYGSDKLTKILYEGGYAVWQMPFSILELPLK